MNTTVLKHMGPLRRILVCLVLLAATVNMSACDMARNYLRSDREAGLEKQDYKDGLAPRPLEIEDNEPALSAIPGLQPYISQQPEEVNAVPLVSISVNQTVPLRDVFFELAQQAGYDIELDPRIRGSVIFTARERPFDQVIERICEMSGLRYKFAGGVLRVELDTPYNKIYKVDYLNYVRSNTSSVSNDVSVVSGDGADTGSNFGVSASSESDFWAELETNLGQILGGTTSAMRTSADPRITASAAAPPAMDGESADAGSEVILQVESLPVDVDTETVEERDAAFTMNRQAGLISVFAPERQQREITEYLRVLKRSVTAQVLIEAKVLEVSLTDSFATGIDWQSVDGFLSGELSVGYLSGNNDFALGVPNGLTGPSQFGIGYLGNDVNAFVKALSEFGSVKALASPRLTVLNNQSAVLNVASNKVFFELEIDVTTEGTAPNVERTVDIQSEIRNVPIGVLINVQPSINLDDRTISLAVRPTVTSTNSADDVNDPGLVFAAASAGITLSENSAIPQVNVQEVDSVIMARSGQPVVIGGLLTDSTTVSENGVPVLSDLPIVGGAFRQHQDTTSKKEVVVFLKATILDSPSDSIHNTDKDLYRRFASDRRPLKM